VDHGGGDEGARHLTDSRPRTICQAMWPNRRPPRRLQYKFAKLVGKIVIVSPPRPEADAIELDLMQPIAAARREVAGADGMAGSI